MDYLIDGYNFLFRISSSERSLEKRREWLISILDGALSSFKGNISIIFDSSEQIRDFAQSSKKKNLDVIYAPRGKTADGYIIELLEQNPKPKTLTIVTSDLNLARQCQHIGAQTETIESFIKTLLKRERKKPLGKPVYRESPSEIERLLKIFEERSQSD